jgi:hypothetical protein
MISSSGGRLCARERSAVNRRLDKLSFWDALIVRL